MNRVEFVTCIKLMIDLVYIGCVSDIEKYRSKIWIDQLLICSGHILVYFFVGDPTFMCIKEVPSLTFLHKTRGLCDLHFY